MAGLTAAQIVDLACQAAKARAMTAQAGQFLNAVLAELCQTYDFDIARGTYRFDFDPSLVSVVGATAAGSGPYDLPADFLRCANQDALFYTISNVPYPLIPCDLSEFDMTVQQAGLQSFPFIFATDLSQQDYQAESDTAPQAYVWPPPSGAYPCTLRYYRQMPDIATPETSTTVPWFPNQTYLIRRVAGELMQITDDERAVQFLGDDPAGFGAQAVLRRFLKLKDDSSNRAKSVQLDRRLFGRGNYGRLPNTKTIGW